MAKKLLLKLSRYIPVSLSKGYFLKIKRESLSDPKRGCTSRADRAGQDGKGLCKACFLCN